MSAAAVYRGCVVSGGNAAMLWTVAGEVYAMSLCGLFIVHCRLSTEADFEY